MNPRLSSCSSNYFQNEFYVSSSSEIQLQDNNLYCQLPLDELRLAREAIENFARASLALSNFLHLNAPHLPESSESIARSRNETNGLPSASSGVQFGALQAGSVE